MLANGPPCCAVSAPAAGGQTCCCGHKRPAGATGACCAKSGKTCCQKKAALVAAATINAAIFNAAILNAAGCCCKTRQPLPAMLAESAPSELRFKPLGVACETVETAGLTVHKLAILTASEAVDPSLGRRLQVILCRWTV